jgi:polygalacturonase
MGKRDFSILQCYSNHLETAFTVTSNTVHRRTDPCLALLSTLNAQGSYLFNNLATRSTCIRDTWEHLPFPDDILQQLAANQRRKLRVQPTFAYEPVDEHIDIDLDSSSENDSDDDSNAHVDDTVTEAQRIPHERRLQ